MSEPAGSDGSTAAVTSDRIFDRRYIWLGLVPVAVYFVFYELLILTRPTDVHFATIDVGAFPSAAAAEAHLRYLWLSAFVLSGAASLAVAAGAALSLWDATPRRDRRIVFGLIGVAAVLVIALEWRPDVRSQDRWYKAMGEGLYSSVFGELALGPDKTETDESAETDPGPSTGSAEEAGVESKKKAEPTFSLLHLLDWGLDLIKACGAVALILIGAAMILTLARRRGCAGDDAADAARELARALARQKSYLMQGATVYVLALVAMLSWMYWPLPFLVSDEVRADYRHLVVGAAVLQGIGYSLGIAALYLPPALLLRRRAERLADLAAGQSTTPQDWLREKGLDSQPLDQLRQMATLLTPTLVGLLPALNELWRAAG